MFKELKKTISINIMDFNFIPNLTEVHNCYKIINTATGKDDKLHDIFELHYIELKKFKKNYQQLDSALDRWSSFLTKASQIDKECIPVELASDKAIVKAIEAVDRMFNEEERVVYEVRMQSLADVESEIASAEEKGIEKGRQEGRKEGIEKGINDASLAIAFNLLEKGIDLAIIADVTGIAESDLQTLNKTRDR
jgi:predicted transposase/invertase (TIGR01784 family)